MSLKNSVTYETQNSQDFKADNFQTGWTSHSLKSYL